MFNPDTLRRRIAERVHERFRFQDPRAPAYIQDASLPQARMDSPVYRICLCEVASVSSPIRFLEIGVKKGVSLALILDAATSIEHVTLCDFWSINKKKIEERSLVDGIIESHRNSGRQLRAEFLDGSSLITLGRVEGDFDIVGVDGSHRRNVFRNDLGHALRVLKPGGFIVIDDLVLHEDNKIDQELLSFVRDHSGQVEIIYRNITNWPGGAILQRTQMRQISVQAMITNAIATHVAPSLLYPEIRDLLNIETVAKLVDKYIEEQDWQALDYVIYSLSIEPRPAYVEFIWKIIKRESLEVDTGLLIKVAKALGYSEDAIRAKVGDAILLNGLIWSA